MREPLRPDHRHVDVVPVVARHDAGWDEVRAPATASALAEHLAVTATTRPPDELRDLAASFAHDLGPDATARATSSGSTGRRSTFLDATAANSASV